MEDLLMSDVRRSRSAIIFSEFPPIFNTIVLLHVPCDEASASVASKKP